MPPQPEFISLEDGHTGMLLSMRKKARRTTGEAEAQQLKSASGTDAKVLAGAISSFAREGRRMNVTAIGAGSINQAVKAIAIARKNVRIATRLELRLTRPRIPALVPLAPLTPLSRPALSEGEGGSSTERSEEQLAAFGAPVR